MAPSPKHLFHQIEQTATQSPSSQHELLSISQALLHNLICLHLGVWKDMKCVTSCKAFWFLKMCSASLIYQATDWRLALFLSIWLLYYKIEVVVDRQIPNLDTAVFCAHDFPTDRGWCTKTSASVSTFNKIFQPSNKFQSNSPVAMWIWSFYVQTSVPDGNGVISKAICRPIPVLLLFVHYTSSYFISLTLDNQNIALPFINLLKSQLVIRLVARIKIPN